ncbi:DUF3179 domain-containing (seleno)protein [Vibrio breoganii]|uniref:DUF3179 domain-containing protein n=1 Tax=Vibrio breoganii TaxID=553239 RepID=A0AAP8MTD8_9VIBR|nr:DUF3179 domain-containing (seleno)protein [Vibrio breoganii]NMO73152.1 DUF3179 domain-containing protein [Vibrio breoganii]NMR69584.1 DUF3179 domain-containing protein [Vibrio breoganii]PMF85745.1 hypothetical protein BCV08_13695 [Vibrio breoganii]PMG05217.1 hypothetical protein BCV00_13645 [Vibrio breoganii]PMG38967.1 hypothetical protein BCU93_01495 [Vibrio breoganii]
MKKLAFLLAIVALLIGAFGAIALTEAGQIINMPREWVFGYFEYRQWLNLLIVALAIIALYLSIRFNVLSRKLNILYGLAIIACLFFINLFAPEFWLRAQQHGAEFISVEQADQRLTDDTDIFVLEIDGDARAYPRDWMQLPHIVGDNIGGQDTVMTYCALSNLPIAFNPNMNGQKTDFRIIAQVHNNLIFTDRNSGELIQQVTGTAEYSQTELVQYPVQRMNWKAFKQLYPEGKVFDYNPTAFDKLTLKLFDTALEPHYAGEPMFPTLTMEDDRLATGEQIWGVNIGEAAVAVAKSHFDNASQFVTRVGTQSVLFVYYDELDTVAAYLVENNGIDWEDIDIDPYGKYVDGQLTRANLYSGMPWMIWSHWFPQTEVLF